MRISVPQEIIDIIIDSVALVNGPGNTQLVAGSTEDNTTTLFLRACSLVHRTWTYRAQYNLFRCVSLPSWGPKEKDAPKLLNRLLDDPVHQHLRHYIRELELFDRPSVKWGLYYRDLFPLLRKITRLKGVHIVNINWTILFPHLRRDFLTSLPPPSELSIGPACSFRSFVEFLQFILHFRDVESLYLQSPCYRDCEDYEDAHASTYQSRLVRALETCIQSNDVYYSSPTHLKSLYLNGRNLIPFISCISHPYLGPNHYLDLTHLHTLSVDSTNYSEVAKALLPALGGYKALQRLSVWIDSHDIGELIFFYS